MAHTVSLTDGTTTLYLQKTPPDDYQILEPNGYPIQTPQPAITNPNTAGDDTTLTSWEYGNVTESIRLFITGSDRADLQTDARAIEVLLDKARQRQKTGMGAKVYIQVNIDGEAETWRSEILAGRLLYAEPLRQISLLKMEANLSITRRYYWEGAEQQLSLNSSEDAGLTTVDAYNNDDATPATTNFARIATWPGTIGADGVIPAPARIKITNDAGVSLAWRDFYLTNFVSDSVDVIDPFLLGGEAADGNSYTLTTTEAVGWRWTPLVLTSARLAELAGRNYHVLVAFSTGASTTGVYLRAKVEAYISSEASVLYTGGLVNYNGIGLVDLGVVPLMPGGHDPAVTNLALSIAAYRPAGGATMVIDFVQLTPAGDGLFQRLRQAAFSAGVGASIISDGIENLVYFDTAAGENVPVVRQRSRHMLLYPGRHNRLRFLFNEETGFVAGRRVEISIAYRPRRLDL